MYKLTSQMAMVSNRFQGALCVRLGFHRHLRYLGDLIRVQIQEYVQEIEELVAEADASRDYWTHARAPPKVAHPSSCFRSYVLA